MNPLSNYIVDVYNSVDDEYKYYCPGYAKITDDNGRKYFELENCDSKKLLGRVPLDSPKISFQFNSKKRNGNCFELTIDFGTTFERDIEHIGLKFDASSSASFTKFKEDMEKYTNTLFGDQYYSSGSLKYSGPIVDGMACGTDGREYYDDSQRSVLKYKGGFEDGVKDGEGTFYSKCKTVSLHCNNIVAGTPYDCGELKVIDKTFDITFSEFKDIDLNSDDLCYSIARTYVDNLNELIFESLSDSEKLNVIFKRIQKMETAITQLDAKSDANTGILNRVWKLLFS